MPDLVRTGVMSDLEQLVERTKAAACEFMPSARAEELVRNYIGSQYLLEQSLEARSEDALGFIDNRRDHFGLELTDEQAIECAHALARAYEGTESREHVTEVSGGLRQTTKQA